MRQIYILLSFNYLDVKNLTHPVQSMKVLKEMLFHQNAFHAQFIHLSPVELTDYDDPLGFFVNEPTPERFLTLDDSKDYILPLNDTDRENLKEFGGITPPYFGIFLSD